MRHRIDDVFDSLGIGWLTPTAKVLAGLVLLAGFAFIAAIIALDAARGTTTSTEALIVPFVAVPVGLAIAAITLADRILAARRRKPPARTKPRQHR